MPKKSKSRQVKVNIGSLPESHRKGGQRGTVSPIDASLCHNVKVDKAYHAARADKKAGKSEPTFRKIEPTPPRSSPTEFIIPRSKAEADILAGGNQSSRHRQLPCRTYISTGCCPYKDRCIYLHDPRVQSIAQSSGKTRAKNKEDIVVDSFFWPMLKYNSKSVEDEYDVPIPEKDDFEGHDEAIYSIWQHYVDFCIVSTVAHSKTIAFDHKSVSSRNVDAKKVLKKYSHRSGVREPLDQQRNDGVNRYISKDRLLVFQDLSRGDSSLPFSDPVRLDAHVLEPAQEQKERDEEGLDALSHWTPSVSLLQFPDLLGHASEVSMPQPLPFEIGHLHPSPMTDAFGALHYVPTLPHAPVGSADFGTLSNFVYHSAGDDEEESKERDLAHHGFGHGLVLREPAPSSLDLPPPDLADDLQAREGYDESPLPSADNSPRVGIFTLRDISEEDVSHADLDTRALADFEVGGGPFVRLSAESLQAHEDCLRISDGSGTGIVTPLLDMTKESARDYGSPSRLTEETDVEMISPLPFHQNDTAESLPKTFGAPVFLPLRLPDDLDVGILSDATEGDSWRHAAPGLSGVSNQSVLDSDNAPPPRLSASPRGISHGAHQQSKSRPSPIAVQYALRDSCENAVRSTLLSPPSDSLHKELPALSPRAPMTSVTWPEENDHVPLCLASSSIDIPNAPSWNTNESGDAFIPIVYGTSTRDEVRTPLGIEVGHDLISSRDSSSNHRAFQTPSPATMASAFAIGRPQFHNQRGE